jgi:hypothetical protein
MHFVKEALRYGIRRLPILSAVSSRDGLSSLRVSFYHLHCKKYNILIKIKRRLMFNANRGYVIMQQL